MSVSRANIVTRVKSLISNFSMITDPEVVTIVQAEHDSILNDYSWSRRKAETTISTVATYSTGTVSSVGTALTGSGTTFTSAMEDRWIRGGSHTTYIKINTFVSATALTLETSFPSDLAAGTAYTIFQHVYNLPSDFGRILNVTGQVPLREATRQQIDNIDPYRSVVNSEATNYLIHGFNSDSLFEIELWPVPSSARVYRVQYLRNNSLASDSDQPLYRASVLIWKAAEACCFFLHARTGDAAWLALADRYHQRYLEDLEGAKEDDLGKFSVRSHVKDGYGEGELGSDWYISHDPIRLI